MIMTKVPQHPRPHHFDVQWAHDLETAASISATMIPLITYDEGLGVINSYKSNPQNASFAEYAGAKCYPTSRINKIFAKLQLNMSKEAINTDKVHTINFATMLIATSFQDGQFANDEVSTQNLNEILELQNETTDRQTFPTYNAAKMPVYKSNGGLDLEVGQEGLTTDLELEGINFLEDDYYDCLHYYTNGKKLRTMTTGLKWDSLNLRHPTKTLFFNQQSQTKYMNPYAGLFLMVYVPNITALTQVGKVGDTAVDAPSVECTLEYRYQEFNFEFNHTLQ